MDFVNRFDWMKIDTSKKQNKYACGHRVFVRFFCSSSSLDMGNQHFSNVMTNGICQWRPIGDMLIENELIYTKFVHFIYSNAE